MAQFQVQALDLDPVLHPTDQSHAPAPDRFPPGTLLRSQRHGITVLVLDPGLSNVDVDLLKSIARRKADVANIVYLPGNVVVLQDEVLHQGRELAVRLPRGTLCLSPGGHPNAYLLDSVQLPLVKELSSVAQILTLNPTSAQRNLQHLVDIPPSFVLMKEDVLYEGGRGISRLNKGTLLISRSGGVSGLVIENLDLPLKKPVAELESVLPFRSNYESYPIETLIQRAASAGPEGLALNRGTILFSPRGKVYFVWKEGVRATSEALQRWRQEAQITDPGILFISTVQGNRIGGPGVVITQDEIRYLHDVFRQSGTATILKGTLLLENKLFYKFLTDMPYAHTGRYSAYRKTNQVVIINSFRKGTFSVELGASKVEITDLDFIQVRRHLQPSGRILIKMGTLLRITDEKKGDWIYNVKVNTFYPYEVLTRPYLEEFIPDSVAFERREERTSIMIGPQEKPQPEDRAADGSPVADLRALVNLELDNERTVFVLEGTLFYWQGRLYRVNEELVFRPQVYEKIEDPDLVALESEWKIHPVVEEAPESEPEVPDLHESEEELDDLPYDQG